MFLVDLHARLPQAGGQMFTQGGAASQLGLALIDTHFEKRFEPDDRRPAITAWAGQ
ncbi:hypothetical protein CFII68_00420 [Pseudomonas sp. CFII68]|nr:hypothetical protein CFII68_00420 [Pseudomonas sp. CFII68]